MWRLTLLVASACGRIAFDARPDGSGGEAGEMMDCIGTVACYGFDDGAISDRSGNGNNGVAMAASFDAGHRSLGLALALTSNVVVPESANLTITDVVSVDAWVFVTALPTAGGRSVIVDHDSNYIAAIFPDAALSFGLYNGVGVEVMSPPGGITTGRWTHVAGTYDGATLTIWIDGTLRGSSSAPGPIADYSGMPGMRIGGNLADISHPGDDPLIGTVDELRVWHGVLTAAQICRAAGAC